jgi:hypothetical protein
MSKNWTEEEIKILEKWKTENLTVKKLMAEVKYQFLKNY